MLIFTTMNNIGNVISGHNGFCIEDSSDIIVFVDT